MDYIPATNFCTQDQITNLQKLLDFLKSGKSKTSFNMFAYSTTKHNVHLVPSKVENECGTVCCLAGHGPLAGLAPLDGELWEEYVSRVFTKEETAYFFLFDPEWGLNRYQPSKEQATFRLELFLKKGLPAEFSILDSKRQPSFSDYLKKNHIFSDFKNLCVLKHHTLD